MNIKERIKFHSDPLKDDITAYADGRDLSFPMVPNSLDLNELFRLDGDIAERKKVLDDTDQYNSDFLTVTSKAKLNDREYVMNEFGGRQPTFQEVYEQKICEGIVGTVRRAEE